MTLNTNKLNELLCGLIDLTADFLEAGYSKSESLLNVLRYLHNLASGNKLPEHLVMETEKKYIDTILAISE